MSLIFIVFIRRLYLWKHKKKILFIVTWLELSVSFTEEFSVGEFSAANLRTVRIEFMWVSGKSLSL